MDFSRLPWNIQDRVVAYLGHRDARALASTQRAQHERHVERLNIATSREGPSTEIFVNDLQKIINFYNDLRYSCMDEVTENLTETNWIVEGQIKFFPETYTTYPVSGVEWGFLGEIIHTGGHLRDQLAGQLYNDETYYATVFRGRGVVIYEPNISFRLNSNERIWCEYNIRPANTRYQENNLEILASMVIWKDNIKYTSVLTRAFAPIRLPFSDEFSEFDAHMNPIPRPIFRTISNYYIIVYDTRNDNPNSYVVPRVETDTESYNIYIGTEPPNLFGTDEHIKYQSFHPFFPDEEADLVPYPNPNDPDSFATSMGELILIHGRLRDFNITDKLMADFAKWAKAFKNPDTGVSYAKENLFARHNGVLRLDICIVGIERDITDISNMIRRDSNYDTKVGNFEHGSFMLRSNYGWFAYTMFLYNELGPDEDSYEGLWLVARPVPNDPSVNIDFKKAVLPQPITYPAFIRALKVITQEATEIHDINFYGSEEKPWYPVIDA